ncbi:TPA: hypothetical protein ACH3X2_002527 [Trebouxia sp. C0005]
MQLAKRLYERPMSLPEHILDRGLSNTGDVLRLRHLFQKLEAGQPINIVVIGGSITCGGNTNTPQQIWVNLVFDWLNATWPHPGHKFRNSCKPATPSMLFSFCLHNSVPDDTDLLFMEFTVNDNMGIDRERGGGLPGLPVMENEWRRGFERMLRLAYQLPSQPAMFYLHTYQPEYEQHSFWQGGESQLEILLEYYGIPAVSARNALYHLEIGRSDGFADEQVHCGVHPNPLGHIYYADIVIAALQDIAFHTLTKVSHHMHKDLFRSLTSLPAPMLEDNYESNNDCVKDGALKDAAVMGQTQGWEWVDEGKPGQPSKWGWRTLEPLQSIVIETPSTMSSLAGYQGDTLLGIGYLESFNHMGQFSVECISGCQCEGLQSRDTNWGVSTSVYLTAYLVVSQSPHCQLKITSLQNTSSDGHKIKFDTIIVATSMTARWAAQFNALRV